MPTDDRANPANDKAAESTVTGSDSNDVPYRIRYTFWIVVFVLNVAILATSVGVLLLIFGHDPTIAVPIGAIGLVCFFLAGRIIYRFLEGDGSE